MDAPIQLQFGPDGDMTLLIHRDLWQDLIDQSPEDGGEIDEFVRIPLGGDRGQRLLALAAAPASDQTCRPRVFQIGFS